MKSNRISMNNFSLFKKKMHAVKKVKYLHNTKMLVLCYYSGSRLFSQSITKEETQVKKA